MFYSALAFAVVGFVVTGVLRIGEYVETANRLNPKGNATVIMADALAKAADPRWETRAAGVKAIAGILTRVATLRDLDAIRPDVVKTLKSALADRDSPVRAEAATALAQSPSIANLARGELIKLLDDEDFSARFAAARALLTVDGGPPPHALEVLGNLLAESVGVIERQQVLLTLRSAGPKGRTTAAGAVARMLASQDELVQSEGLRCVEALEFDAGEVLPAVEALFESNSPNVRGYAFQAAALATNNETRVRPRILAGLEAAVADLAVSPDVRESALNLLLERSPQSVYNCSRALLRQAIDNPDVDHRFVAVKLIHKIDPNTLAGKGITPSAP
jgi:hypothetical protein